MGRRPPVGKPSFMKILVGDFSKKLLIPPKFVRLHRGTLARKCIVRPTGTQDSWRVRTKQINSLLYFKKGWKKFAQHHSLGFGDLLVFRYAQDCEFHVDMFDKSCCFKDPVTSQNIGSRRDTTHILPRENKNYQTEAISGRALEAYTRQALEPHSNQALEAQSGLALEAHSSQALELHSSQAREATHKFSSLSKYPSYPCVLHYSYVQQSFLYVPPTFVKQMNATSSATKVKLQCRGKEWDAVISTYGIASKLNRGWNNFARENSLQIGDACVLELIKTKDAQIRVTIFKCVN